MKNVSYYELLTHQGDEIRMNFPISALKFSKNVNSILFKHSRIVNGKVIQKFPLVKDLVNYGKTPLMGLVARDFKSYNEIDEFVLEIEEKLARLGLKLKDSEFTVGDVRVTSVPFEKDTKQLLEKLKYKIQTLDDLSIFGYRRLSHYFESPDKRVSVISDICKNLETYGLKLDGSEYRINPDNFFSLDAFSTYLPPELQKEVILKKSSKTHSRVGYRKSNLNSLTTDELLVTSINLLPLSPRIKSAFDTLEIETVNHLIHQNRSKLRTIVTPSQLKSIEDVLAIFNLQLKDTNYEIVNGKIIRSKSSRTTDKAPKLQDYSKLSKEEQENFLSTPILEFGLAPYLEKPFKEQDTYITMRDLLITDKRKLGYDIGDESVASSLEKLFSQYGFQMKKADKRLSVSKYVNEVQIDRNNLPENPDEETKQSYLEMPLLQAGFTPDLISVLHDAGFEVQTIGDVVATRRNTYFASGITDAQIRAMRSILLHYGHNVYGDENNWRCRNQQTTQENTTSKEDEYEARKVKHMLLAEKYLEKRSQQKSDNPQKEDE